MSAVGAAITVPPPPLTTPPQPPPPPSSGTHTHNHLLPMVLPTAHPPNCPPMRAQAAAVGPNSLTAKPLATPCSRPSTTVAHAARCGPPVVVRSIPSSVDDLLFVWLGWCWGTLLASAKFPKPRARSPTNSSMGWSEELVGLGARDIEVLRRLGEDTMEDTAG